MNFDPDKLTSIRWDDEQLEKFILFCVAVAGKTAKRIASQLELFLSYEKNGSPFDKILTMLNKGTLLDNIKKSKIGNWNKLNFLFSYLATSKSLNLKTCTPDELESIKYIGVKTARFFVLHTRKNQRYACPDTHWRKEMVKRGYSVPDRIDRTNKDYFVNKLEPAFLEICDKLKVSPAELDLKWWLKNRREK